MLTLPNQLTKQKGFTLIELMVTISIIGLLAVIVLVTFGGNTEEANKARGQQNQANVKAYCAANPGASTLNGDTVYCDEKFVMWTVTLDDTYTWGPEESMPAYAEGDCNNLTAEDMEDYPACNACANLDYAGYDSGWRLPTQGRIPDGSNTCSTPCGRDDAYCASGRQLWDFGKDNCSFWGTLPCDGSQGTCSHASGDITWDTGAAAGTYWSSLQYGSTNAWAVYFNSGATGPYLKSGSYRVRCFLGQYW
jgi:prepilin-type N-terminal cleavage/methylation domain-containing protein